MWIEFILPDNTDSQDVFWHRVLFGKNYFRKQFNCIKIKGTHIEGFPDDSAGKESTCSAGDRRCGFDPWVGKIPWRRKMAPHSSIHACHGQKNLVGCSPQDNQESDRTKQPKHIFIKT